MKSQLGSTADIAIHHPCQKGCGCLRQGMGRSVGLRVARRTRAELHRGRVPHATCAPEAQQTELDPIPQLIGTGQAGFRVLQAVLVTAVSILPQQGPSRGGFDSATRTTAPEYWTMIQWLSPSISQTGQPSAERPS
ncbi:hypothetical protein PsYK624_129160 [Phanerochaete sordida]|uniref:Uncharacterized protein n=1 Tax=Phanerochaete sordida TaxID=48140 RepID=A0A9P3GK75_9APHY|nr:hypothetical protein PsYK624_129160 [Phanerochaete sordida]